MKSKILVFIIGLLVGSIITASGFLIYQNTNKNNNQILDGRQMMERPNGEEPPDKPNFEENDTNRPPEPPTMDDSFKNDNEN